jgi:hypothetical protein
MLPCLPASLRRNPVAACVTMLFVLGTPSVCAAADTWTVTSCDQGNSGDLASKSGSLRFAVGNAVSGDIVDMTGLACGTISLSTGAVHVSQANLTIKGPGSNQLAIVGTFVQNNNQYSNKNRIFTHSGTGTLKLYDLAMSAGYWKNAGVARGGCIYSKGNVTLVGVAVSQCTAKTDSGAAFGGAVYTIGNFTMMYSTISSSSAFGGTSGDAAGGGVFAKGDFHGYYSTITGNSAKGAASTKGNGGGLLLQGDVLIGRSTISNNVAGHNAAGIDIFNSNPRNLITSINDSTISGNSATYLVGGIYANSGHVAINNSTIAFNAAKSRKRDYGAYFGAGAAISAAYGYAAIDLQSTLISNNTAGNKELDLTVPYADTEGNIATFTAAPANNLIRVSDPTTQALLPADTITSSCPLLGPLRDNGGPTWTHALLSTSPAIDAGNDTASILQLFPYDQRGSPYARNSGVQADIGAYEVQQEEIVFNAGFDGCPASWF